ncbi:c-type cytochrome [Cupriavidus basilensis]|uniref:c-type cytochrome n=1 Tax=Cupriavidus basilensis TaxID=68895 RepID=UPI0020A651C7|nr:c-type cytochrome [Cupriavidus basilensis]MCP3018502.1 c-type cytochrome [Cupriavidus basilensis]
MKHPMERRRLSARVLALCTLAVMPALARSASEAGESRPARLIVEQVCAACHGNTGQSTQKAYPSLAGQNEDYLFKQLRQFKAGASEPALRKDATMAAVVQSMSETELREVARYFSRQAPARGHAALPHLVGAGMAIYWKGNPSNHLPACVTCHRPNGEGIAPDFPRIAGQQPEYVARQLHAWKSGTRGGPGKLMSLLVPLMTDEEILAVAQYVAQLR